MRDWNVTHDASTSAATAAPQTTVHGHCAPGFEAVGEAFRLNFVEGGDVGASVAITWRGESVVDLWGGVADPKTGRPWQKDTVCMVWSSTKGAVALCAHMLADRGELDLDAPVARYWPQFAQNGKQDVTVAMLLSHQSGLPALREPIPEFGLCDWEAVTSALAAQRPYWQPGTQHGYHALTFGHLVGEVVRRISGLSLGTFFQREVAAPLGLDFWIGLPEELEGRVAPILPPPPPSVEAPLSPFIRLAMSDKESIAHHMLMHSGTFVAPGASDQRAYHAAEIPAANGITNARSLAAMYRPLALDGGFDGVRLVSSAQRDGMGSVVSAGIDAMMQIPTRFALGYVKSMNNQRRVAGERDSILMSEEAFGHTGAGGSLGFADPRAGLSFAYVMNQQASGIGLGARGQALVDAAYESIGYHAPKQGAFWRPA
ncbi:MAG: serine hydrolase [Proteobacteria bacterium]|nr:serine hydrolase [Pseudomonadota bacterium]